MRQNRTIPTVFSRQSITNVYNYTWEFGVRNLAGRTIGMLTRGYFYNQYVHAHMISEKELAKQKATSFSLCPVISIIVPTFNTPEEYLIQMIESVLTQSYVHWELCIADGSPDHNPVESVVKRYQRQYPSIRFKALEENLGIAGNTNAALELAGGDYIALLDHDDFLSPDALFEIVRMINAHPDAEVLYTDEDKYDSVTKRYYDPNLKPDFDQDYLLCCNYITHFYIVKKTIADQVHGFSTTMDGSQDYDFILRTTEQAAAVYHIPKVLYHWRIHSNSVAGDPTSKMYAYDAAEHAINSHFQRYGIQASASKTKNLGFYHTTYQLEGSPLVSIVMTHCDAFLKKQIRDTAGFENIEFVSRWNDVKGEYILFLDRIAETPAEKGWMKDLVSNCQRPEIGIVSGKVCSTKNHLYEYGLIYDADGRIISPFFHHPTAIYGYYHLTESQHCVSLVGRHFLMISREDFDQFVSYCMPGKIDERFFYELCLFLRENGKRITLLPHLSVRLSAEPHHYFEFYTFDVVPAYIRQYPYDPMYNRALSVAKPYIL